MGGSDSGSSVLLLLFLVTLGSRVIGTGEEGRSEELPNSHAGGREEWWSKESRRVVLPQGGATGIVAPELKRY